MYAVIRHKFVLDIKDKWNSKGEWQHKVWLFNTEQEAMAYAVSLLSDPVLIGNEHYLAHALERLHTGKFWQLGNESVAVGEVLDKLEFAEDEDEKLIH
jgi:hypothetical protein